MVLFESSENKYIEYKREYSKTFLKTVSAFANYHDGTIIFGIDDTSEVVGIENPGQIKLIIEHTINDSILPVPLFEIKERIVSGKIVIELKVMKSEYTPYYYKNKAYKRSDTSSVEVDKNALNKLILEGENFHYELLESKVQSLTFDYLERKLRKEKNINSLSLDVLKSLELLKNDKYTNSAALVSDFKPIKNSTLILIKFENNSMNIKDRLVLDDCSIIEQFDISLEFYRKHIMIEENIENGYRKTLEEIPLKAYREAVVNAIIHRDYMSRGDIKIEFFSDHISIISPGSLVAGISEKEFQEGRLSIPGNRILADIFLRLGIIEKFATGIRRIKEQYLGHIESPVFEVLENSVVVTLPKIKKSNVLRTPVTAYKSLSKDERLISDFLQKNGEAGRIDIEDILGKGKTQTIKIINKMINKEILFTLGNGKNTRYLLKNKPHRKVNE
jgi:ATP-dependent DNA helicase RecG